MKYVFSCFLLVLAATTQAAPPTPVIKTTIEEGQEIVPGDLVSFDASETTEATGFKWAVIPAKYADNRPTNEVSADGKTLRMASRPGVYMVILAVTNKDGEIALQKRDVIVGKPTPSPGPSPQPNPQPQPTPKFPDEEMGMSTVAFNASSSLSAKAKAKLPQLTLAFLSIGGAAAAGGFSDVAAVEKASTSTNRVAICGTDAPTTDEQKTAIAEFLPFFKALQPEIQSRKANQANTPASYGKMLIEIGKGIAVVK